MKKLVFIAVLFLMVPAVRAQQDQPKENPAQVPPQEVTDAPSAQDDLPASVRPGHPLDPADVDILTGKRDQEAEAAQRTHASVEVGGYGYSSFGDFYTTNGWHAGMVDRPLLPLTRFTNPFFFLNMSPRGFGGDGFRGRR